MATTTIGGCTAADAAALRMRLALRARRHVSVPSGRQRSPTARSAPARAPRDSSTPSPMTNVASPSPRPRRTAARRSPTPPTSATGPMISAKLWRSRPRPSPGASAREMALEARAGALEARGHPLLERRQRLGGDRLAPSARSSARRAAGTAAGRPCARASARACRRTAIGSARSSSASSAEKNPSTSRSCTREQQFLLAREVEVDGALGEPRLVGHLGDAGDAIGRAHQQPLGRIEDRVVALLLVFGLDRALAEGHRRRGRSNDSGSIAGKAK